MRLSQKLSSMGRRNKFGNEPTVVEGIRFASKLEAKRWGELKLLERAGNIRSLERQPRFPLIVQGEKIAVYVGDFAYVENDWVVVEDTKGFQTREFRLKWVLAQALNPSAVFRLYPPRTA